MTREDVFRLVEAERGRQGSQWMGKHAWGQGDCSSPLVADPVKAAVLMEECGEVARAVLDIADVRSELVQVAAVAIAWLEGLS
jgi:hypothetical protein